MTFATGWLNRVKIIIVVLIFALVALRYWIEIRFALSTIGCALTKDTSGITKGADIYIFNHEGTGLACKTIWWFCIFVFAFVAFLS